MIRRLTLGRQSDIAPDVLQRRLEAAEVIGLAGSLAAKGYFHVSFTDTTPDRATS
jgi:hypothetical protein